MRLRVSLGLAATAVALVAAVRPAALGSVAPGEWELTGLPNSHQAVRQCIADIMLLAQYEHRSKDCSPDIVSDNGTATVISYTCGAAGFGRSEIDVLTPRSLRIRTQGISDQLPFDYTIQAHRIGDCVTGDPPRH